MDKRSEFHEYMLGGAFEAVAKQGVADAIADLKAAGIDPVYSSTLTPTAPLQNSKVTDELATQLTDKQREARRLKNLNDWMDRMNQGSIRMSTDEAYRLEVSKKLS